MLRVADYIFQRLVSHGVRHVFLVTGGGAMHLNDAIGRTPGLKYVCCHHEQSCSIAAEAYTRLSGRLAAVNVTSGPGGTNAITGVYGAWTDSIAQIVISGNVKWETLVRSTELPLRQLGDQEIDIVRLVAPVTKYAVCVSDPKRIRYHLERALHLATSGRPGPVWLDIPMNVQGAMIDPESLDPYDPAEDAAQKGTTEVRAVAREILARLKEARRPVILASGGVRVSGAQPRFIELADRLKIPVTTAWNSHDLIWDDHPAYVGRPGIMGDRAGNFAVQNSDFLLSLGCRLSIRQVSYDWKRFAPHAYKVVVDIDAAELKKPTIRPDLPVHADVRDVIEAMLAVLDEEPVEGPGEWLAWCTERRRRYPVVLPEYREKQEPVNPYCFIDTLFRELPEDEIVACGDGTACVVTFQAAVVKRGTRIFHNSGSAPMGYDLPAAIGACHASGGRRVICLAGDGSIMMNLQELQTIVSQKLPIKIFLLNNGGYHSIRQTQNNYFRDNPVGFDPASGVSFPDFSRVAAAFGIPFRRVSSHDALSEALRETIAAEGPQLCEVLLDPDQPFAPKLASRKLEDGRMVSAPLEDMAPFLSREELRSNLLPPLSDSV